MFYSDINVSLQVSPNHDLMKLFPYIAPNFNSSLKLLFYGVRLELSYFSLREQLLQGNLHKTQFILLCRHHY